MYNQRIKKILILLAALFCALGLYIIYMELIQKETYMASTYNQRIQMENEKVVRGNIYDRNDVLLAGTEKIEDRYKRIYPYDNLYAHVIGYNSSSYGTTLLESKYNAFLLPDKRNLFRVVASLIEGKEIQGDNLHLTLNHQMQEKARGLLGKTKGAIVAMNPQTGEVIALVSTPDYDTNDNALKANWKNLIQDVNSPLLPRATKGSYPPGSTFKVVSAVAAIESGFESFTCYDEGMITIDGKPFKNAGDIKYGDMDLKSAMKVSSNVYFSMLSEKIGSKSLVQSAEKIGFNASIPFELNVLPSVIPTDNYSKTDLAATSIGQGKLLTTPFQMALVACGIANKGTVMKPYLVESITSYDGTLVKSNKPEIWREWTKSTTASALNEMLVEVVNSGTGKKAGLKGIQVAGKTGTAQIENKEGVIESTLGWFIGYAPSENPTLAFSIILEDQNATGSNNASVIAKELVQLWISLENKISK